MPTSLTTAFDPKRLVNCMNKELFKRDLIEIRGNGLIVHSRDEAHFKKRYDLVREGISSLIGVGKRRKIGYITEETAPLNPGANYQGSWHELVLRINDPLNLPGEAILPRLSITVYKEVDSGVTASNERENRTLHGWFGIFSKKAEYLSNNLPNEWFFPAM